MDKPSADSPRPSGRAGQPSVQERIELLEMSEALATVGHWQLNVLNGDLFWSDEIYRIHGVSPDDYVPSLDTAIAFYHPDDRPRVEALVAAAIERKEGFEFEFRLVRRDGSVRDVQSRGRVRTDHSGKVTRVFGVFQDITERIETERQLQETRSRLDLAVTGSNVGLWWWDVTADTLYWSPRYLEMMGLDAASFTPTFAEFADRLHPAERASSLELMDAHLHQRVPYEVEHRLRREDGEYVWIHARGQAQWDQSGKPLRVAGSVEDISMRKREESFRNAVYAMFTAPDISVEHKIVAILELGRDYLKNEHGVVCKKLDDSGHIEFSTFEDEDSGASARAIKLFEKTVNAGAVVTHHELDERSRCIGIPLRVNGEIYGTLAFFSETEEKRAYQSHETGFLPLIERLLSYEILKRDNLAQVELERQNAALQRGELDRILNTVPLRIWYKDDKNTILRLNKEAAVSMNMPIEEAEGANAYDLFPAMAKKYHEDDLRVIRSGEAQMGIVEQYTPRDGEHGWISTDKLPFEDQLTGEPRLLVVSRDITPIMNAQRRLEAQAAELQQSNNDLDQFAYIASHDLRAPMRGVRQLSEWIEEDLGETLDDEVRNNLRLMSTRVTKLDRMLTDMLEFARAGKRKLDPEPVDVPAAVKEVIEWVAPHEDFTIIDRCPPMRLRASRTQLQQMLLNLVNNGLKHHDRPNGTVVIEASTSDKEVRISVRDDGPGIPEKFQSRVFDMFLALPSKGEYVGSGIGLAVVARLTRAYAGTVSLRSPVVEDRGSEFVLHLPLSLLLP